MEREAIRRPAARALRGARTARTLLVAGVCCGVLAACGGGGDGDGKGNGGGGRAAGVVKGGDDSGVASLESPTADGTAGAAAGKGGRPKGTMVSPSMSDDEINDIHQVWYACLKSKGAPMFKKDPSMKEEFPKDPDKRQPRAAYDACADKEPYLDPLYDKESNPKYAEQTTAWMACMNKNGVEVSGKWDDDFFTWGKVDPKANRQEVSRTCYSESYTW